LGEIPALAHTFNPEGAVPHGVDAKKVARLAARVIGIAATGYGAFLVVVASALQSMDAGPRIPAWMSTGMPLVAIACALAAAFVLRRRTLAGAAMFALAGILIAWPLLALSLRPLVLIVPAAILVAAAIALAGVLPQRSAPAAG